MNALQEIESNTGTFVVDLNSIVAIPESRSRGESMTMTIAMTNYDHDDEVRVTKYEVGATNFTA